MIAVLLILIPLIAGLATFFMRNEKAVKAWSLFTALVTVLLSASAIWLIKDAALLEHSCQWLQMLGSSFSLKLDAMGQLLCLLSAVGYLIIFISTWKNAYSKAYNFYGLMLLALAGLMGVFLAMDALLLYFFWELTLIPVYFLCSQWGGERRIQVTLKFFLYTFIGSILMLVGIIYLQSKTADHSFSIKSFYQLQTILSSKEQSWLFWLFFIAFAVKMPIFPFHTWQPETYQQSPTATTMVLSGIMVKMGLLGLIRWLVPVLSVGAEMWSYTVIPLALIGLIYASLIALRHNDIKLVIAYSSIAHIALMCVAVFASNQIAMQGVLLQMFNHGINIIGMWMVADMIEKRTGTTKFSGLGGLAQKAPAMAIFFVIISLANIALPLTNGFAGEFLMFAGIMKIHSPYYLWFTIAACTGVVLGAAYTLRMVRKVFYGKLEPMAEPFTDLNGMEKLALSIVVIIIIWLGVYPQSILHLTDGFSKDFIERINIIQFLPSKTGL